MIKTLKGDLIKMALAGDFSAIVHGCNCFCTMGAGIAAGIRAAFPEAYRADLTTGNGDRSKLGACSFGYVDRGGLKLLVVNAYTQFDYRGPGQLLDYGALRSCMEFVADLSGPVGMPMIGAGLARGDWDRILGIITEVAGEADITIVEYQP